MNIQLIAEQIGHIHLTLETSEAFEVYGGTALAQFEVSQTGTAQWTLTVREQVVAAAPLRQYNVYARHLTTGREWEVLSGKILVSARTAAVPADKLAPVEYHVSVPVVDSVLDTQGMAIVTGIPGPQGPQGVKGDTGASAYQLATQHGYTGTEAEWVSELQGAQDAAAAAKNSAATATTAAATATAASTAAAKSAADADSTLNAAAKKTENNTFTGTNTFNGEIAANGGITGLPVRGTGSNAVSANAMGLLSLVEAGLTQRIPLTWGTPVGNITVTNGELFAAPQNKTGYVRTEAVRPYGFFSFNIGLSGDIFIPLKMSAGVNNAHVRVDVLFTLGGWSYNEQLTGWPVDLEALKAERGSVCISLEVHRDSYWNAARVALRAVGYAGAETTSGLTVTEREYNVQRANYNPFFVGNQAGLLGVLLARDTADKNKMVVLLLCGWDNKQVVYRLATIPFGLSVQGGHSLRVQVTNANTGTVYLPCLYYRNRCGVSDVFVDAATALGAKDLATVGTTLADISCPLTDYITESDT